MGNNCRYYKNALHSLCSLSQQFSAIYLERSTCPVLPLNPLFNLTLRHLFSSSTISISQRLRALVTICRAIFSSFTKRTFVYVYINAHLTIARLAFNCLLEKETIEFAVDASGSVTNCHQRARSLNMPSLTITKTFHIVLVVANCCIDF